MIQENGFMISDDHSQSVSCDWSIYSAAIADSIRETLRKKCLLQKDLACAIGLKPQQISRILKGNVNLTLGTIIRLEAALGMKLLEVVTCKTDDMPVNGARVKKKKLRIRTRPDDDDIREPKAQADGAVMASQPASNFANTSATDK